MDATGHANDRLNDNDDDLGREAKA
jgi:hypothetical protein